MRRPRPACGEAHDILRADEALEERALQHEAEVAIPQFFEQRKEALDVALPRVRALINQLGEIPLAHGTQLENSLAHEVEFLSCAGDRRELRGALPRQIAHRAVRREARMDRLVFAPGRDDLHALGIEPQRRRDPHAAAGIA